MNRYTASKLMGFLQRDGERVSGGFGGHTFPVSRFIRCHPTLNILVSAFNPGRVVLSGGFGVSQLKGC